MKISVGIIIIILASCISPRSGVKNKVDDPAELIGVDGLTLILKNDCFTCHKKNERMVGPSFLQIAERYDSSASNISTLSKKVLHGGAGVWGKVIMTPHPNLTYENATAIIKYILSIKNK